VAAPSTSYEPRCPGQGALYQVVRDHFETFRAEAASLRDGEGLPGFVEQEFRDFLRCGWLAGGFARFRCGDCGLDRLVPFSCKTRALCPSCGGRRMAERAAHLLDHVFPDVPVRQWVLSLPCRLRYQLAWNHDVCRGVVAVFLRAVLGFLRARARDTGVADGRGGAVAVIQRFGGSLNLNLHVHALVLDGVFARNLAGALTFHPTRRLTALDVEEVLATVEPHIKRLLDRRGLGEGDDDGSVADAWVEDAPVLAGLAAASVQGTAALGRDRGARLRRLGERREGGELPVPGGCHARANGFDLHAGLVVPAGQRDRLERVGRYALRPPVTQERIHLTDEGQVRLQLRQPWRDGTTDVVFDPVEFLGRLAVLVPRPRINLILYHGVLGPRAAWRADVVRRQMSGDGGEAGVKDSATEQAREGDPAETARRQARGQTWAALMERTFGFDVLACPRCGGRLRLIALIEEAGVIQRILRHVGVPTEIPAPRPARAPPIRVGASDQAGWDDDPSVFDPCS
jgi:Putative transposase/Transposase zinc-binding domain